MDIQNAYYHYDKLKMSLTLESLNVNPEISRIVLDNNGEIYNLNSVDKLRNTIDWEGNPADIVSIEYENQLGQGEIKSKSGQWAMIRLMKVGSIQNYPNETIWELSTNENLLRYRITSSNINNALNILGQEVKVPKTIF